MYPLNAAHLFDTTGAAGTPLDIAACSALGALCGACAGKCDMCAMLAPNRSISPRSSLSLRFNAPFLLRRLWCLILPERISAAPSPSANSGSASARLSSELSVVVLLLFAFERRRGLVMRDEDDEAATREIKDECLIVRLSRLDERKASVVEALGRKVLAGARGWMEDVMRAWRRAEADGLRGGWGAFHLSVREHYIPEVVVIGYLPFCVCVCVCEGEVVVLFTCDGG